MEELTYSFESLATKKMTIRGPVNPLSTPIYLSSTFVLESAKHGAELSEQKEVSKGSSPYLYSRWGNPTNDVCQRLITSLEGGEGTIITASGMNAITTAVLSLVQRGDHMVVTRNVYGGAYEFFTDILPKLSGVEVTWVNQENIQEYIDAIKPNTKLFYGETIANPSMVTLDVERLAKEAQAKGIVSILDCTFSSVYNIQPIKLGIDIVIHSASKYYGGHSDLIAGTITARTPELLTKLNHFHRILGGTASPNTSHLLQRGIKTLYLRMKQHNQNALVIAKFLESHPKVENVYFLGLETHRQHELAKKQFGDKGYGGMISFDLKGGYEAGKNFVESLKLITLAVSLGGIESLIQHCASMTHTMVPKEDRLKSGITDGMLRFSVGCENVDDLIRDLENAFAAVN